MRCLIVGTSQRKYNKSSENKTRGIWDRGRGSLSLLSDSTIFWHHFLPYDYTALLSWRLKQASLLVAVFIGYVWTKGHLNKRNTRLLIRSVNRALSAESKLEVPCTGQLYFCGNNCMEVIKRDCLVLSIFSNPLALYVFFFYDSSSYSQWKPIPTVLIKVFFHKNLDVKEHLTTGWYKSLHVT